MQVESSLGGERKRQLYKPTVDDTSSGLLRQMAADIAPYAGLSWSVTGTSSQHQQPPAAKASKLKQLTVQAVRAGNERLRVALLQQHEHQHRSYAEHSSWTDRLKEGQTGLVDAHTVRSLTTQRGMSALSDSDAEENHRGYKAFRGEVRDAYLYGVSHYTLRKAKRGTSSSRRRRNQLSVVEAESDMEHTVISAEE